MNINKNKIVSHIVDFSFYGPALIVYFLIIVFTAILGFYYSLTDWDGLRPFINFVGLENYVELLKDPLFYNALLNTLFFAAAYTVFHNIFGLMLALFLKRDSISNSVSKALIFIPCILSPVIISIIWDFMYQPGRGPLSSMLTILGFNGNIGWTGDPALTMPLVIFTQLWYMVGLSFVIYNAGLKSIPKSYYEAAQIDGAGSVGVFRFVTLPLLSPVITIVVIYDLITSLKVFELMYIMTKGGPGYVTETVTIMVFREAFRNNRMGYSTAISVVLFILVFMITIMQLAYMKRKEVEY